jgi:hypothetical protein
MAEPSAVLFLDTGSPLANRIDDRELSNLSVCLRFK